MGGKVKTFTQDVIIKDQPLAYLKSKMETALVDLLQLSGHLLMMMVSMNVTMMRCCSIYLAAVTSQLTKQEERYTASIILDHFLEIMSDVYLDHLMVIKKAEE